MFIVYTPIFAVSHGLGASTGSVMIAIGSALLVLAPFWGRVVKRTGMRSLLLGAYVICGIGTIATGLLAAPSPGGAAAVLLLAAIAMSAVDGMGNVPYLRAVRPHQRTDMTPIYNTYRDVAQVAPAGLFAILLAFLPLPSVFIATGVLMILASGFCLYLPRRF
jgi:MFS family permease